MKTVGIIGGIGPESTVEYYRQIIATYREQKRDGNYPAILLNSINLNKTLSWFIANEWGKATEYLIDEVQRLARAGADFGVLASNTHHVVFEELSRQSPIPLLSSVEATCEAVRALGLSKVGLFGTRFIMQGRFYLDAFARAGITVAVPEQDEQTYIHDKYLGELVPGIFLPETHAGLLAIVDRMIERQGIEGLILGGTELPLILREEMYRDIPFLDTTKIHVERIVAQLLS
jgi:aspartate racemase